MAELSAKALELRDRVRDFMCTQVSGAYIERTRNGLGLSKEEQVHWHGLLDGQGWLANHWPQEWGGTGWTALERYVFDCETAVGNAPRILPFGVSMLAPVILKFGTQQQKECWLPRIRSGGDWWCQCYSEPGAGTDLASLKTSAVRDGEHYVVNGQKTWTTFGQYANMMFCLVRTNHQVKAQEGISFLLIDMDTPGIEVRPLYMLNGEHEVNEVFFNDVRVPVANLVGEENKGWDCAKYLLTYERTGIAGVGICISLFNKLRALSEQAQRNGRPLIDDALFRQKLAKVWMDIANLKETNLRILMQAEKGGVPGAESSVLKILGTEIRQELFSLLSQAAGSRAIAIYEAATAGDDACPTALLTATDNYFNHRKLSIFGGSNQTGQMLAALTDLPQATFASRVEVAGDKVSVTREVDGGLEALSLSIPAIITTDLRMNEPRYVTLPNIMKAKKKQLEVFEPEELGVDVAPRIKTLKVSEPAKRGAGVKVADVAALVDKLKNEAKVI